MESQPEQGVEARLLANRPELEEGPREEEEEPRLVAEVVTVLKELEERIPENLGQ